MFLSDNDVFLGEDAKSPAEPGISTTFRPSPDASIADSTSNQPATVDTNDNEGVTTENAVPSSTMDGLDIIDVQNRNDSQPTLNDPVNDAKPDTSMDIANENSTTSKDFDVETTTEFTTSESQITIDGLGTEISINDPTTPTTPFSSTQMPQTISESSTSTPPSTVSPPTFADETIHDHTETSLSTPSFTFKDETTIEHTQPPPSTRSTTISPPKFADETSIDHTETPSSTTPISILSPTFTEKITIDHTEPASSTPPTTILFPTSTSAATTTKTVNQLGPGNIESHQNVTAVTVQPASGPPQSLHDLIESFEKFHCNK